MSTVPIISALPQFSQTSAPDDLAAASPIYQALLAQTGGNLGNLDALATSQPNFGPALSLMNPGGGLNPAQASQFGPLFGLLMSLWAGGQPQAGQGGQ